jgi:hypothetical protein
MFFEGDDSRFRSPKQWLHLAEEASQTTDITIIIIMKITNASSSKNRNIPTIQTNRAATPVAQKIETKAKPAVKTSAPEAKRAGNPPSKKSRPNKSRAGRIPSGSNRAGRPARKRNTGCWRNNSSSHPSRSWSKIGRTQHFPPGHSGRTGLSFFLHPAPRCRFNLLTPPVLDA